MITTLKEFQAVLDTIARTLRPIRDDGFLNEEGIRTIDACDRLSEMVEFHNNFKEYSEDEEVQEIFKNFNDCRKIRSAERFLKKRI
jgi:hypothetical protein